MRQSSKTSTGRLRSPFASKRVSSISLAIVAVLAIVGSGIGMQVASAKTAVKNPGKEQCGTKKKPAKCPVGGPKVPFGKTFTVTFTDGHAHTGYQSVPAAGHKVCFATAAPNKVSPACSTTNGSGIASTTFTAKKKGAATVTVTESLNGTAEGTLTLKLTVS